MNKLLRLKKSRTYKKSNMTCIKLFRDTDRAAHMETDLSVDNFGCAKKERHAPQGIWAGMLKREINLYNRVLIRALKTARQRERGRKRGWAQRESMNLFLVGMHQNPTKNLSETTIWRLVSASPMAQFDCSASISCNHNKLLLLIWKSLNFQTLQI